MNPNRFFSEEVASFAGSASSFCLFNLYQITTDNFTKRAFYPTFPWEGKSILPLDQAARLLGDRADGGAKSEARPTGRLVALFTVTMRMAKAKNNQP